MTELIKSFKRYFAFAILMLILLILLWLRFFVAPKVPQQIPQILPTPHPSIPEVVLSPTQQIPQSPQILPNAEINFNYSGPDFSSPATLPVYSPKEPFQIDLSLAKTVAEKFGFSELPTVSEKDAHGAPFYLWQKENKVFSVGGSFPAVSFNNYDFLNFVSTPSDFNEDLLTSKAREQLQKLSLTNVDLDSLVFRYFKTSITDQLSQEIELMEVENKNEASYVGLGLTYKLGDYQVISNAPFNLPIFLIFDLQGNLFELTAYLFTPSQTSANITVSAFNQSIKQINQKGVVFYAGSKKDSNQKDIPVYKLKTIDLSSVSIVYYLPIDFTKTISPYYIFKSTGLDQESKTVVDVVVMLPIN